MFNSFYEFTYIQCVLIGAMCGYSKAVLGITLVKKGIWVHNIVNEL